MARLRFSIPAIVVLLLGRNCGAFPDRFDPFEGVDTIKVFNPAQVADIQAALDPLLPIPNTVDSKRLAVFLEAGDYGSTSLHVGYFTSVAGLGARPSDVKTGLVRIDMEGSNRGDPTTIFWRSVENMQTDMNTTCSQGISFRRILADNFIHNAQGGSGGFIGDCLARKGFAVGGQQYFVRNTQAEQLKGETFNTLYLGCKGTYGPQSPSVAYIDKTPAVVEKPYLTKDGSGAWRLIKPGLRRNSQGPSFDENGNPLIDQGEAIDFSQVFVAKKGATAATINQQIASGKHIIMTPYVHHLEDSIVVDRSGIVVLGVGLATLECADQKPCLIVGDVDDVRIAGLTIVGGIQTSNNAWVQIGDPNKEYVGDEDKPSVLSDNHIIVGYYRNNSVQTTVQINNGNVLLDHSWSWRSDIDGAHGESHNGFEIRGKHVKAYGLFAEHHWKHSLAWYGEFGQSYFFQCETPWDAGMGALQNWQEPKSQNNTWRHWPLPNWYDNSPRCYYVDDQVKNFFGVSVGAYSMEGGGCSTWCGCQETRALDTHIQIPNAPNVTLLRATCWKNCGGGVQHCINHGQADTNWIVHTSWCNGKEVPYLGMQGKYSHEGRVSSNECDTSSHDMCADYVLVENCSWTRRYSCPGQPAGSSGSAGDDGTIGYDCCCRKGYWKNSTFSSPVLVI